MFRLLVVSTLLVAATAHAGGPPTVLPQSVHVRATSMGGNDWVPLVDLLVTGDVPDDGLAIEYTKAKGAAWGSAELPMNGADDRGVRAVRATMLDPKLATTDIGEYHFAIDKTGMLVAQGPIEPSYHESRMTVPTGVSAKGAAALYGNAPGKGAGVATMYDGWKKK